MSIDEILPRVLLSCANTAAMIYVFAIPPMDSKSSQGVTEYGFVAALLLLTVSLLFFQHCKHANTIPAFVSIMGHEQDQGTSANPEAARIHIEDDAVHVKEHLCVEGKAEALFPPTSGTGSAILACCGWGSLLLLLQVLALLWAVQTQAQLLPVAFSWHGAEAEAEAVTGQGSRGVLGAAGAAYSAGAALLLLVILLPQFHSRCRRHQQATRYVYRSMLFARTVGLLQVLLMLVVLAWLLVRNFSLGVLLALSCLPTLLTVCTLRALALENLSSSTTSTTSTSSASSVQQEAALEALCTGTRPSCPPIGSAPPRLSNLRHRLLWLKRGLRKSFLVLVLLGCVAVHSPWGFRLGCVCLDTIFAWLSFISSGSGDGYGRDGAGGFDAHDVHDALLAASSGLSSDSWRLLLDDWTEVTHD